MVNLAENNLHEDKHEATCASRSVGMAAWGGELSPLGCRRDRHARRILRAGSPRTTPRGNLRAGTFRILDKTQTRRKIQNLPLCLGMGMGAWVHRYMGA